MSRLIGRFAVVVGAVACVVGSPLAGCGWNDVRKPTGQVAPAQAAATPAGVTTSAPALADLWQLEVERIDGSKTRLGSYKGKALLIVNTASECGFTPQYAGLQQLYERYRSRGFEVLAFPSNDFGGQEPGEATQIQSFCSSKFQVSFPLFAKVHARGDDIAPLYRLLTERSPAGIAGPVKWNFTKFLVTPAGAIAARFEPAVAPMDPRVTAEVDKVLPPVGATGASDSAVEL